MRRFLQALRRRRRAATSPTHAEVVDALHALERQKRSLDRYDPRPNEGYATPFDGGQYPGFNPGGPY